MKPSFYEPSQDAVLKSKTLSLATAATHNQDQRQYPAKTSIMVTLISSATKPITTAAAQQENNGQTTASASTEEVHQSSPPFQL